MSITCLWITSPLLPLVQVRITTGALGEAAEVAAQRSSTKLDDAIVSAVGRVQGSLASRCPAFAYYLHGVRVWLPVLLVFQAVSAAVFVEISDANFGDACWNCWVTASTVGYGLVAGSLPGTWQVRLWSCFYILASVTLFASTVGHLVSLASARKAHEKRMRLKDAKLDGTLIAHLDRDGNGVDRMEYVIGMLTQRTRTPRGLIGWRPISFECLLIA